MMRMLAWCGIRVDLVLADSGLLDDPQQRRFHRLDRDLERLVAALMILFWCAARAPA
jgi:hypothetical protein